MFNHSRRVDLLPFFCLQNLKLELETKVTFHFNEHHALLLKITAIAYLGQYVLWKLQKDIYLGNCTSQIMIPGNSANIRLSTSLLFILYVLKESENKKFKL